MTDLPPLPPLPILLAGVEEIAGRAAALKIAEHLGGTRIYIPKRPRAGRGRELAESIGLDALSALAKLRGGEEVEIPRARQALVHHLHFVDQRPNNEIARRAAMSERKVRAAVKNMRAAFDQLNLFATG